MHIPTLMMWCITLLTGLLGMVFLVFPARIGQLEAWLNAPWGDRELASLRFGLRGEQGLEQVINRNVLTTQIVWDNWLRQRPRLVGVALCLLAVWLGWQL